MRLDDDMELGIFADVADLPIMRTLAPQIDGFTTNPSLLPAASR